jgi:cytochrome c oxidase assembly protein subunit 15
MSGASPQNRALAITARIAMPTAALMYALIIIGSIVRTTGSGLACPDWPLCFGRLIPAFDFQVFMEWWHRLIALVVGLGLFANAIWIATQREARERLGGLATLTIVLYFTQALLGAFTVWHLLDPSVVSGHLAVGLLLFSVLWSLALVARHEAEGAPVRPAAPRGLAAWWSVSAVAVWMQAVLGGMVSTNHASLVCPDWPTCNGEWFPPMIGLVAIQMAHRFGAYLLIALLATVAWRSRRAADPVVRRLGVAMLAIVLMQAVVGVVNLMLRIPVWVSAVHLGLAALLLALAILGAFRLSTAAREGA